MTNAAAIEFDVYACVCVLGGGDTKSIIWPSDSDDDYGNDDDDGGASNQ